jgi:polyisoprenoid-binding protein YceI
MAVHAGRQQFGPERGRILLLTTRDGLAAQAGHDLTIEVTQWSAELEVADDLTPARLAVRADMNSLIVREGKGGVKPLTDRDRREIAVTARKLLLADRFPAASFTASGFDQGPDGGGSVQGTLSLAGSDRPVRLEVTRNASGAFHATGSVRQSDFGIKPYTAFLGVLKVSDAVAIAVNVDLPDAAGSESGSGAGSGEPS